MGEPDYALAFTLVVIAGMSTCIGASFVLFERCTKLSDKKVLASSLALSAGVMIYVSFVEIFQKSLGAFTEQGLEWAYGAATLCFFSGFALTAMLDVCVAKIARLAGAEGHGHSHGGTPPGGEPALASKSEVELVEGGEGGAPETKDDELKQLEKTGVLVALALGLHNLPEGLVTFVATLADPAVGVSLCIAIAIHNVPEGVCVAMPIFYSTGSRKKAFLYSFISGLAELVGALIGWAFISATGNAAFGVVFGVVGGMMIYICLSELLPTAFRYDPTNQFVTNYVLLGMLIMALSLVLFSV
jgi:ZIP family zinc transporter